MEVSNNKWPLDRFLEEQKKVLNEWPTGQDVDFAEAVAYHKKFPLERNAAWLMARAKEKGEFILQPRAGVATFEAHLELLTHLQDVGLADIVPTSMDSYTRDHKFENSQKGIEESYRMGRSMLNGFPAVNHGVPTCRKLFESLRVPVHGRGNSTDIKLICEVRFAGGFTGCVSGPICSTIYFSKDVPFEVSIPNWQYVERLIGLYEEQGVPLFKEHLGLTVNHIVPPGLGIAGVVLETLLAAGQGVRHIGIDTCDWGHMVQDVAAIRAGKKVNQEYIDRLGYKDVVLVPVSQQWLGPFPPDEARAFGLICQSTAVAVFGGVTEIMVKSSQEGAGLPTKESNSAGVLATRQVVKLLKDQDFRLQNPEIDEEQSIIEEEVRNIVDAVLDAGDGDVARGIIRGFASGVIDAPFAPSRTAQGLVMPVRDATGARRYLDFGRIPFSERVKQYHIKKIAARRQAEGQKPNWRLLLEDVNSMLCL